MAYTSVDHARHRAESAEVKNISVFDERPRRWRWSKRPVERELAPAERSTFPQPDAQTQVLPPVPAAPPARPLPQVLYRERPIDLDKAACNISLAGTRTTLHRWSAIKLEEELAVHLRVVHALAERERAEARKLLERPENATAATGAALESLQNVAEAERKANELPGVKVTAEVDTDAFGADLGAVWNNAQAVTEQTAQFQRITPGMPDPRVQVKVEQIETVPATASLTAAGLPSPVHMEGSTPPVPDEDEELADPGAVKPLPQRQPRALTSFEARLNEHAEPVDGEQVEALDLVERCEHGTWWLLSNGWWEKVASARVVGDRVDATLARGVTEPVHMTARVHILSDEQALKLRSEAVSSC